MVPRRFLGIIPGKADFRKILVLAEKIAGECDGCVEGAENSFKVSFCPEGEIFFSFDGATLRGETTSSIAGPGFHAMAVDFCDLLARFANLKAVYEGEDPYLKHRDFDALCRKEFLPWLGSLLEMLEEQERKGAGEFYLSWPLDRYHLEQVPSNYWICPTGIWPFSSRVRFLQDPEAFSRDFFIWPHRRKDVWYHRNQAMSLAWTEYSFLPDDPLGDYLRESLERVAGDSPKIPFPKKLYRELCEIGKSVPVDLDALPEDTRFATIGFRKYPLREQVFAWELLLPGGFGRSNDPDGTILFYGEGRTVFASVLTCELPPGEEENFFRSVLKHEVKEGEEPIRDFRFEKMHAALSKVPTEQWEFPYLLFCVKAEPGCVLYLSCNFREKDDYQWGLDLLQNARCRNGKNE